MSTGTLTVHVRIGEDLTPIEGHPVVPGLAITPSVEERRFSLTHTSSGLAFMRSRCRTHIDEAAELVRQHKGIDWTVDEEQLTGTKEARAALTDLADAIRAETGYLCTERCDRDPNEPSWSVRCVTCDWEWTDEYDEGPLNAEEAKRMADDHECEPRVELLPPGDGAKWVPANDFNRDGTPRAEEAK